MATIIEFQARSLRHDLMKPPMSSAPADVVLFPGVRYERADLAAAEEPRSRSQHSPRRDRLELED